jgi:type I restriction enzyme M protein
MTLAEHLKDSAYKLTQFSTKQIQELENKIIVKQVRDKATPYIICLVRGKEIKLTHEEIIRQLYLMVLIQDFNYPIDRIAIEYGVTFGRETKRADICIFDKDRPTVPYILVELKKPKQKDGKEQLKSYCNATGAPIGVWTNGDSISWYQRKDPNYFEDIPRLPTALEKLSDVLSARWTIDDLIKLNKLVNEKKSLKDLILEMEDEVLANAGVDVFEELFKLIFTKLYDEMEGWRDKKKHLVFRNYGDTETELKTKIQNLFDKARDKWEGVFTDDAKLQLTPSHLSVCIASLESVMLFNSNLDVVDEAFEYLINKSSKGEKGQYFTPRYVIDMCVKMLNPQEHETLIDTAAGSCGFPVHGIFHVWEAILKSEGLEKSHLFTAEAKPSRCIDYVQNKVFAIDFDEKAVRVGRTLNLIAGDGQTNVLHLNTLDYERWDEKTKDESWPDIYSEGWKKLKKLRVDKNSNRDFQFDVLMANPPFAGDIKESRILAKYEMARSVSLETIKTVSEDNKNIEDLTNRNLPTFPEFLNVSHETIYKMADGTYRKVKIKNQSNVGRDILFIERNLSFLKAGGRMAVVLPQGRFNNSSDKQIREYIAGHCRILAVVGLHGNVFKPHTGTKTSVLFVQKWHDKLCPQVDDYPIFFATMTEPSKDNSGDKIYISQADGEPLLDEHGHLIVKHDLFNHDGLTQDGIAEAFIEFAKKEKLSFFDLDLSGFKNLKGLDDASLNTDLRGFKNLAGLYVEPFNEVKYRALLEKLEISEILLSEVKKSNEDFRFHSEFFSKNFLASESYFDFVNTTILSKLAKIADGDHSKFPENQVNEIRYLQARDISNNFLEISSNVFVSKAYFAKNQRSLICGETILLSIMGTVGDITITPKYFEPCMGNRALAIIRDINGISPQFLFAYLTTKHAFNNIERQKNGGVQQRINLDVLGKIEIPLLSKVFQNEIEKIVILSQETRKSSKNIYSQAENLLLNALGMADFSPSTEKVNIKLFKDSFIATGRLDAEYYQPKYEEIMAHITAQAHNKLSELVIIQKSVETGSEAYTEDEDGLPYLRVADYNKFGITEPQKRLSTAFITENYKKLKDLKPNAGTILFSKDGSVGEAYCLREDANFITSGAVLHLTIRNKKTVLPEYLTLALNSTLIKMQSERDAGGSIILHWRISEIENVIVPIVDIAIQTKIADLIRQSFTLKAQSEALLTTAKRAVELAIETNEQTALDFIAKAA